jgi:hypothetical protein
MELISELTIVARISQISARKDAPGKMRRTIKPFLNKTKSSMILVDFDHCQPSHFLQTYLARLSAQFMFEQTEIGNLNNPHILHSVPV